MKENEASSTAFTVVQGILFTAGDRHMGPVVLPDQAEACRRILAASDEGRRRLRQLDNPLFRRLLPVMEGLIMPGIARHYVLRKRFIEDAVTAALDDGVTQVVNLGAGFDMLAWRLHRRFPDATFVEIDHPATSAIKRQAVGETGANLHLLAADLAETSVEAVLGDFVPFERGRRTVYICEGVLMYLDETAVTALFAALKHLTGAGSRFVFTATAPMRSPNNNTGLLLRLYLTVKAEPLNWSLEKTDLEDFVGRQGYRLLEQADDDALLKRYRDAPIPGPVHRGEFLAVATAE